MSDFRTETTEYTPTRAQTVQSDVLVPLAWSFVAGLLLGGATGIVAVWQGWAQPVRVALCVFGAVCIGGYFFISAQVRESWWSRKEQVLEPPAVADPIVRTVDRPILMRRREGAQVKAPSFSFAEFVRACEVGGTAEERWIPVLGETTFDAWRDRLIDAGWAKWRSKEPRHGWTLTAPAEEIIAATDDGGDVYEMVMDCLRGWW